MQAPRDHSPEKLEQAEDYDDTEHLIVRGELANLERLLIPLLKDVRKLLGKKPIYIPKE